MAPLCAMLLHRFENGKAPLAVVSMDNCSHNGEKLRGAVLTMGRPLHGTSAPRKSRFTSRDRRSLASRSDPGQGLWTPTRRRRTSTVD